MFEKLEIWKESVNLIKEIYILIDGMPKHEEYNLKSQLRRAIVSVSLNIAEGKCRATSKEFAHFLNTSSASLYEVKAILLICEELEYLSNIENIYSKINLLNKRINSLRNKLMENCDDKSCK